MEQMSDMLSRNQDIEDTYLLELLGKLVNKVYRKLGLSERELILVNCYKHFGMVIFDFLSQKSIDLDSTPCWTRHQAKTT